MISRTLGFNKKHTIKFNSILRNLFVQTSDTPNPNFLKFMPSGKTVMEKGTHDFSAARHSYGSPLAKSLFTIDGVTRVFYGKDYISIGKDEGMDWGLLKPQIYEKIENFYSSDLSLFDDSALPKDTLVKEDDSEAVALIKEILETKIRPNVQEDGGDIEFIDFDEATGVVYLEMKGACTDCPSSQMTLKSGIERLLTHYVAEVTSVEATDSK